MFVTARELRLTLTNVTSDGQVKVDVNPGSTKLLQSLGVSTDRSSFIIQHGEMAFADAIAALEASCLTTEEAAQDKRLLSNLSKVD